ncbi:MAG: hypothetical protein Q4G34_12090, partial [Micrococcus sp.]|nr:hypothetical protein [Micrococcus sp.]
MPLWAEHGLVYDTSRAGSHGLGARWPYVEDGVWQFAMPVVYSPAFARSESYQDSYVLAMDYNFWAKENRNQEDPAARQRMHDNTLDTYRYMYASAFAGSRAPLVIGNHFNAWNDNAFNPAVETFMREVCGREETYCVTHRDVIQWLSLQDPERVREWQAAAPDAVGKDLDTL